MKWLCLGLLLLSSLPGRAQQPAADTARLDHHLRYLTSRQLARSAAHPAVLDSVAGYLARQLRAAGGRVMRQPYQVDDHAYQNVIASLGPEAGPRTTVGAHYNVRGEPPGADDNRRTAKLTARPPCWSWPACWDSIHLPNALPWWPIPWRSYLVFAFHTWAATCTRPACAPPGCPCKGMVALEMLGYYDEYPGSQRYPSGLLRLVYGSRGKRRNSEAVGAGAAAWPGATRPRPACRCAALRRRPSCRASTLPTTSTTGTSATRRCCSPPPPFTATPATTSLPIRSPR